MEHYKVICQKFYIFTSGRNFLLNSVTEETENQRDVITFSWKSTGKRVGIRFTKSWSRALFIIGITSLYSIKPINGLEYGIGFFLFTELIQLTDCFNVKFRSGSRFCEHLYFYFVSKPILKCYVPFQMGKKKDPFIFY